MEVNEEIKPKKEVQEIDRSNEYRFKESPNMAQRYEYIEL